MASVSEVASDATKAASEAAGTTVVQHITNFGTSAVSGVKTFLQVNDGDELDRTGKLATAILEIGLGVGLMSTARSLDALPIPFIGLVGTVLSVTATLLIGHAILVNVLPYVPAYANFHADYVPEALQPWLPAPSGSSEPMHEDIGELTDIDGIKKFLKDQGFGFELSADEKRTFNELKNLLNKAYQAKLAASRARNNYDGVPSVQMSKQITYYVDLVKASFKQAEAYMHLQYPKHKAVIDVATIGFDMDDEVLAMQSSVTAIENKNYITFKSGATALSADSITSNLSGTIAALAAQTKKTESASAK